jgi:hypothetical protein
MRPPEPLGRNARKTITQDHGKTARDELRFNL